jgi:hypothetical protein
MEAFFHRKLQHIVKNADNRKRIFTFLEKNCLHEPWMTETEKHDHLRYIIYEIYTEWNVYPKLDELFAWIKSNPFAYGNDVFHTSKQIIDEEDDFIINPPIVDEGVNQCRRCKSFRTFSFTKQTRSSDEASTVFVSCTECGLKFKM